jgi:hypothetical protein
MKDRSDEEDDYGDCDENWDGDVEIERSLWLIW